MTSFEGWAEINHTAEKKVHCRRIAWTLHTPGEVLKAGPSAPGWKEKDVVGFGIGQGVRGEKEKHSE